MKPQTVALYLPVSQLDSAHLNGRKPPMAMCTAVCLYHGCVGICRAMLRVRQGAWKLPARFFPTMPPMTVRGNPTSTQAPSRRSTVVAGSAWVEPLHQWMEFTTLHVRNRGAVNKRTTIVFESLQIIHWEILLRSTAKNGPIILMFIMMKI